MIDRKRLRAGSHAARGTSIYKKNDIYYHTGLELSLTINLLAKLGVLSSDIITVDCHT